MTFIRKDGSARTAYRAIRLVDGADQNNWQSVDKVLMRWEQAIEEVEY